MPYEEEQDDLIPRIGRPEASPLPPISLRGIGSVPIPGMPENNSARPSPITAPAPAPAPAAKIPSALGARRQADETELARLRTTGSGVSQVGKSHPVAGGLLRGLNVVGGLVAPGLMSRIPGTEEHHQQLVGREQGNVAGDIAEQEKEAQTAKAQAEAEAEPAKAEADRARAEALKNPPDKNPWSVVPGVVGPGGKVLQENKGTGELRWSTEGGAEPLKAPAEQEREKDIKDYLAAHQLPDTPVNREKARDEIAKRAPSAHIAVTPATESWQLAEGEHGEPILFNSKTGETKAAPAGLHPKGTLAGQKKDYEKNIAPIESAMNFADTYLKSGAFTGSDDDTLMLQYFELAKPESGFRLNTAEIKRQNEARSWRDSLAASYRHATTGTWFSDDQRKQIVESMHHIGEAKKLARQAGPGGSGQGGGNTRFQIGADQYDIPPDKKAAFLQKHPEAKPVQ